MSTELYPPLFCVFVILILFVGIAIWGLIADRRRRALLTDEQRQALTRQGNILGVAVFISWGVMLLGSLCNQTFPGHEDLLKGIAIPLFTILGIGTVIYVSVLSIKDRISILRDRGSGNYPQGQAAIMSGISGFVVVVIILLAIWGHFFEGR